MINRNLRDMFFNKTYEMCRPDQQLESLALFYVCLCCGGCCFVCLIKNCLFFLAILHPRGDSLIKMTGVLVIPFRR